MKRRLTKGTGCQSEKRKTAEMPERGGGLHEDSEVYERRHRAGFGLRKGEFLSHRRDGDGGRGGGLR